MESAIIGGPAAADRTPALGLICIFKGNHTALDGSPGIEKQPRKTESMVMACEDEYSLSHGAGVRIRRHNQTCEIRNTLDGRTCEDAPVGGLREAFTALAFWAARHDLSRVELERAAVISKISSAKCGHIVVEVGELEVIDASSHVHTANSITYFGSGLTYARTSARKRATGAVTPSSLRLK